MHISKYFRRGEIVEGVSVSDGHTTEIEIHVHNLGLVTTVLTTQIKDCSSHVEIEGKQHTEAINPHGSATFLFKLKYRGSKTLKLIQTCTGNYRHHSDNFYHWLNVPLCMYHLFQSSC